MSLSRKLKRAAAKKAAKQAKKEKKSLPTLNHVHGPDCNH
jgi:hypothetical protein